MLTYLEQLTSAAKFLESIPFEHRLRGVESQSVRTRLSGERNLVLDMTWPNEKPPRFCLLLMIEASSQWSDVQSTLRCWALQSFPACEVIVCAGQEMSLDVLHERVSSDPIASTVAWRIEDGDQSKWLPEDRDLYILFAEAGDLFHPSLAAMLAFRSRNSASDVIVWNTGQYARGPEGKRHLVGLLRRPQLQPVTLLNYDYIGRAFSVRASVLHAFDRDVLNSFRSDAGQAVKIWLAGEARAQWETHPEYLTLLPTVSASPSTSRAQVRPTRIDRERLVRAPIQESVAGGSLKRWEPVRLANSLSVVIPFRDQPDFTLRTIASICAQRFEGEIEIVLVNNQSSAATIAALDLGIRKLVANLRVIQIAYPKAFNHSRQCNLGAREARGDVVVFLNNDAELVSRDLLDGFARWTMLDRVATVGCRIESYSGALVCAGLKARRNAGYDYHSMLEENRDADFANCIREVIGNTFACAAVRRDIFERLGGLDEVDFPVGYNDVDFCLRARQQNYRHLYLGHHTVKHEPGTSRGKSDEALQKILLRERYPSVVREGMFQFENADHLHRNRQQAATKHDGHLLSIGRLLRRTLGRLTG